MRKKLVSILLIILLLIPNFGFSVSANGEDQETFDTLYLIGGNVDRVLSPQAGNESTFDIIPESGDSITYIIENVTGSYDGSGIAVGELFLNGLAVGIGIDARVSYDFNGDGNWDRTEEMDMMPTDGNTTSETYEKFTRNLTHQVTGQEYQDFNSGAIKIEIWMRFGSSEAEVKVNAPEEASKITLPYSLVVGEQSEPGDPEDPVDPEDPAPPTNNMIKNGDFSNGTEHWGTWDGEGGVSTFTVENEVAEMYIQNIAGMHPEWGVPISWSTQLFQEGIQLEGGKVYELSFTSWSTIDRPIVVEFDGLPGRPSSIFHLSNEAETFKHEFELQQSAQMDFKFLLGYVVDGDVDTNNTPHRVYFDNIVLKEVDSFEQPPQPDREWELVWSDEFEGNELDTTKWNYDIGNGFYSGSEWIPGWGNNEKQYYTEENISVEDGYLVIEARELDEPITDQHGTYQFTSGKITTENLFSQAYGRFEARMKLPEGQGYWPAFWMMPQDDVYGGWAASGEIDIMENRGSETDRVGAAIHYGGVWPRNTHSGGSYRFPEGQSTTDFNTYSIEWEPGEIRWYVNDDLYTTLNDWHSENGEYPAPFDQEFFMILNLAVGGWYGGDPDETTEFPGQVVVDYVRVYEEVGADYPDPTPPGDGNGEDPGQDPGDGNQPGNGSGGWVEIGENLIVDGTFDNTTEFGNPDNLLLWNVHNQGLYDAWAGLANFSVEKGQVKAGIQQVGWEWWHIQLFQDVEVPSGTYKIVFDMMSERNRNVNVELVGSGTGIHQFEIGNTMETYEAIIDVDANGEYSLMFGLGREQGQPELSVPYNIFIDNIKLVEVEEGEQEDPGNGNGEEPGDGNGGDPGDGEQPGDGSGQWSEIGGNLINDGTFETTTQFGDPDNLLLWNVHNQGLYDAWAGLANFSVVNEQVRASIQQVGWEWWHIQLFQDVEVPSGTYKIAFDMMSERDRNVNVELVRSGTGIHTFQVGNTMETYEVIVDVNASGDYSLMFGLGRSQGDPELTVPYNIFIDNIRLVEVVENGEPGDGEPGDGEPGDGEPGDGEPGDGEPGDGEPGDGEPGDGEPGDGEPGDGEPGDGEPGDGEPGDGEPGDGEPGDGEPGDGEPGDGEPGDGEPGDGEPGDGEPGDTDELQQRINELMELIAELQARIADLEGSSEIADLENRLSEIEGLLEELKSNFNELEEYVSHLEALIKDLKDEIAALKAQLEDLPEAPGAPEEEDDDKDGPASKEEKDANDSPKNDESKDGAELPNTATNVYNLLIVGFLLLLLGSIIAYQKRKSFTV
ncbi:family 16 glycosylhydrolase [Evansella cellulosilytica]|uniref:LPXTG-motif cell wall anchor domain protein n=1 Tax=Evansella cellulosilytica (strain ATCC 21833 / DSM 2522 / FERM P-1141 / JCM 9156 / N-4) TaxID=649639 RepID=E6TZB0_EVAC2|nr:family 16 glycosylhydrolase [Evansella cellulosilytica]ADU28972.1 LPXTG-motif cell wall anchor domain protein [Evansella cellulosilytica DSM 2522]